MLKLFFEFVKIGFIAFGGGWSVIGIIQDRIVSNGWLTHSEFKEILSLAQMTPGPVVLNTATYTGLKLYGIIGAILNSFSVLIAPLTFTSLFFYFRKYIVKNKRLLNSLKFGVTFLIFTTLQSLSLKINNMYQIVLASIAFLLFLKTKIDPIFIILGCGIIGFFLFS